MENDILPLFSSPVYSTYISITTVPEFDKVEWILDDTRDYSKSNIILDNAHWNSIKQQILSNVNYYFYNVMMAKPNISIQITNSWVNRSNSGQLHVKHTHPNSILSGVLFFDYHESGIVFFDSKYNQIEYAKSNFNVFNSRQWVVKPAPGLLLIWPSNVEHAVELIPGNSKIRFSLSFNTWVFGDINNTHHMNLVINQM
jgi:uncharacterized protein (TIGR02466 family)